MGEVAAIGSNVADLQIGDLVSAEGHIVCGRCRHCRAGRRHLCANCIGLGVGRDGAFAEYIAVPMANVWHHWPGIDEDVAAIFDPFGNAVHTALAFPVLGEDVLVSGAGPIGLMATAVVRHAGARFVVVSEPNPLRRELAAEWARLSSSTPVSATCTTSSASWAWSKASTSRSRCPAARLPSGPRSPTWPTAARSPSGIPTEEVTLDLNEIIFKMPTMRGHLRPGDVRDLVQDDGDAPVGPRHHTRDHSPLLVP